MEVVFVTEKSCVGEHVREGKKKKGERGRKRERTHFDKL